MPPRPLTPRWFEAHLLTLPRFFYLLLFFYFAHTCELLQYDQIVFYIALSIQLIKYYCASPTILSSTTFCTLNFFIAIVIDTQQRPSAMVFTTNLTEAMPRKDNILTRRQVEGMIADGKSIIILDGKVLRVDAWLKYHPGGDKAIMHMVGRDATDEINAYVDSTWITQWLFLTMMSVLDFILQELASVWLPFRLARLMAAGGIFYHPFKVVSSEATLREEAELSLSTRTLRQVRAVLRPNRLYLIQLAVPGFERIKIYRLFQKFLRFLQCRL